MKPRVLVLSGYGLNCEEEMRFVFETAGGIADIVHVNDLIAGRYTLSDYQILTIGGGFSYGDDTGAGNAYANKLRNHLWKELLEFVRRDTLVLGICNGFQILVNLGLLPALDGQYGKRELGLMPNDIPRYTVRFVDLKVADTKSPWLQNMDTFSIPVSNGEGKLYASEEVVKKMQENKVIALRYTKGAMCEYLTLPANPNGSIDDIAGITDETGRILGLMPHPERAMFFTQMPNWTLLKEEYLRKGQELPEYGSGLQLFTNGVEYFKTL